MDHRLILRHISVSEREMLESHLSQLEARAVVRKSGIRKVNKVRSPPRQTAAAPLTSALRDE